MENCNFYANCMEIGCAFLDKRYMHFGGQFEINIHIEYFTNRIFYNFILYDFDE